MFRPSSFLVLVLVLACGPSASTDAGDTTTGHETGTWSSDLSMTTTTTVSTAGPSGTDDTGTIDSTTTDGDGGSSTTEDPPDLGRCDPMTQDCPAGYKCMPWSSQGTAVWSALRCFPVVDDPAQLGESCAVQDSPYSGLDDCDVGLICWHLDELGNGICEDMCIDDPPEYAICESPDDTCLIGYDGAITLCTPTCDPLGSDCAPGESCYPAISYPTYSDADWGCFADDIWAGFGTHGDPCDVSLAPFPDRCGPSHVCVPSAEFTACADPGCCTVVCDLDDPGSDAGCAALDPAQTCVPWFETPAPDGYAHVGVCSIAG